MNRFYYDLHIHSCLSPCADDDMTPFNIAGMAKLNGLDIAAVTDHNSVKNCAAFRSACEANGIVPVPGAELTTAEDIHLLCLFESFEDAELFDKDLQEKRTLIPNRPDVGGSQLIYGANDEQTGVDEYFLPVATSLPIDEARAFAERHGAFVIPAHVDRQANSIIAVLGVFPENSGYRFAEYRDSASVSSYCMKYEPLQTVRPLFNSDAHYLWGISERENFVTLDCGADGSPEEIRASLFRFFRGDDR